MSQITINNQRYNIADMTDAAKQQLANVQLVDGEIAKRQQEIAIFQTARQAYVNALVAAVEVNPEVKKRTARKPKSA